MGTGNEELSRNSKYVEGRQRPLKLKFRSQATVEEMRAGVWRLSEKEE